ncbi:MAG: hypothetical protein K8R08_06205 [Methanosarcinales archaeon]|nr:hypothetical protein [Methanosarcinales archaeon]
MACVVSGRRGGGYGFTCMRGRMTENVDVDKRLTLIGDGAGMAATNVNLILGTDINCVYLYRRHQTNIAYNPSSSV